MPLVERAKSAGTPVAAADVFVTWFGLTLEDLVVMFANPNWRNPGGYGGNAWKAIAELTTKLGQALGASDAETIHQLADKFSSARHNTGSVHAPHGRLT